MNRFMLEQRWDLLECCQKIIILLDEVHFHLSGYINKQNCRIWNSENPHVILQKLMHPLRATCIL